METIFSFTVVILIGWVSFKLAKRFPNTITPMSIYAKDAEKEIKMGITPLSPVPSGTALTSKEEEIWTSIVSSYPADSE